MKLRKYVENPHKIECPFCGCRPEKGFDCIDHKDTGDFDIVDIYECPVCKKKSARCYEFCVWKDEEGNPLLEQY